MPDVYCPPVVDDRGRSSDDPCHVWCGGKDFDAWKVQSQRRIAQALMREDIPAATKSQLREWNQQIELLPRSKIDSGDAVRMMAAVARQAECIALAPRASEVPAIIEVKTEKWYEKKEFYILLALIFGGGYLAIKGMSFYKTLQKRKPGAK